MLLCAAAAAQRPQPTISPRARGNAPGTDTSTSCVWDLAASQPISRLEAPSLAIGRKLYVFGGFLQQQSLVATTRLDVYDPKADRWSSRADLPAPVTHSGFAFDGEEVWLVGGFLGNHPGPVVSEVWRYEVANDRWSAGPSLPAARGSGASAIVDRKLHYFGGVLPDRKTDVGDHWFLDLDQPTAWQAAAPLPVPRNHVGGVAFHGQIYAVGGQWGHDSATQDLDVVHVYDPKSDTWSAAPKLPFPRSHFEPGIFTLAGHIVLVGGRDNVNGESSLSAVTTYSPATGHWVQRTPLPLSLLAPAAKSVGPLLIVTGGGTGPNSPIPTTYVHDLSVDFRSGPTRINSGGDYHQNRQGQNYCGDQFFLNGRDRENGSITDIFGTADDALYLTERTSTSSAQLDYRVPLSNGSYQVRLHFAEIYWGAPGGSPGGPGSRVFDVILEGQTVLGAYDIAADVGVQTAVVKAFRVDVHDGALDVRLNGIVDQPKVSAIEVFQKTPDR